MSFLSRAALAACTLFVAACSSGTPGTGAPAEVATAPPATESVTPPRSPDQVSATVGGMEAGPRLPPPDRGNVQAVTLSGFRCGDSCYLDIQRPGEGAKPETLLCTARACSDWRAAGALPAALKGTQVSARFGRADQVDGAGTVMNRAVPAIMALRLPPAPKPGAFATSDQSARELPLTPGVYVLEDADCRNPANAAFRIWTGEGLSGSATKDCRATILSRDGESYTIRNSCVNTYDGSRTPETLTIRVPDQVHFIVDGNRFRSCSTAQVPDALRRLVR